MFSNFFDIVRFRHIANFRSNNDSVRRKELRIVKKRKLNTSKQPVIVSDLYSFKSSSHYVHIAWALTSCDSVCLLIM